MDYQSVNLEQVAEARKISIHDPFAEFLKAQSTMHSFEVSLLDCYRLSGHACHAITGAFLVTEKAVACLFPENNICERGDLKVEFGSQLDEMATGPRANVIGYITGAWGPSGFPGLRGNFKRKDLVTYGHSELAANAVRFIRLSNNKSVTITYTPHVVTSSLELNLEFPEKWRAEICAILESSSKVLSVTH